MPFGTAREPLSAYMTDVHRSDVLEREEETRLARRWRDERDPAAAEELVARNLRFVVKTAMTFRRYGLPVNDLIQEGNLGLMHAVEKFDPSHGTRLISYAVWWIKAYIQAYVIRSWSLVRVGTTQTQRRLFYKLPRMLAEEPIPGETPQDRLGRIADKLRARPDEVTLMAGALRGRDLSLDAPLEEGSATCFGDRVEDGRPDPEELAAGGEDAVVRRELLQECLAKLPEREQAIVRLRHLGEETLTLRQVGRRLGLSRERVRQLEAQALRRLRSLMVPRYDRAAFGPGANVPPRGLRRVA